MGRFGTSKGESGSTNGELTVDAGVPSRSAQPRTPRTIDAVTPHEAPPLHSARRMNSATVEVVDLGEHRLPR